MHPVKLDDGEIELLREARAQRDWSILPTFKLKYLYQRLVAFPVNDLTAVREISKQAQIKLGKKDAEFDKNLEEAFSK